MIPEKLVKLRVGRVLLLPLKQLGFTLIEILVALVMGAIFFTAICGLIIDQTETHEDQQMKVTMQQNGRAALTVITNELMVAGYALGSKNKAGITKAAMDGVTFDYFNKDGLRESVGYSYISYEDRIGRSFNGGNRQSLLRNVETFRILYAYDKDDLPAVGYGKLEPETGSTYWAYDTDSDGLLDECHTLTATGKIASDNESPTALAGIQPSIHRIRAAKLWILMRSTKRKKTKIPETLLDNIPGFNVANLDTDNYSYRLYTTTVKFRNMYY